MIKIVKNSVLTLDIRNYIQQFIYEYSVSVLLKGIFYTLVIVYGYFVLID